MAGRATNLPRKMRISNDPPLRGPVEEVTFTNLVQYINSQPAGTYWLANVGEVLVVDQDGGGLHNTYQTLQSALSAAASGDVVMIVGDYTEPAQIIPITVPAGVTIDGSLSQTISMAGSVLDMNNGSRLVRMRLDDVAILPQGSGDDFEIHYCELENVQLDQPCTFKSTFTYYRSVNGGVVFQIRDSNAIVQMSNCVFEDAVGSADNISIVGVTFNSSGWLYNCVLHEGITSTVATTVIADHCYFGSANANVALQGAGNIIGDSHDYSFPATPLNVTDNNDGLIASGTWAGGTNGRRIPSWVIPDATTLNADSYLWLYSGEIEKQPGRVPYLRFTFTSTGSGDFSHRIDWASVANEENPDTISLSSEAVSTLDWWTAVPLASDEIYTLDTELDADTLVNGENFYGRIAVLDAMHATNADIHILDVKIVWL